MSKVEAEKVKPSFLETVRTTWRPYLRLYSYVKPYRWRFVLGILFGVVFGATTALIPFIVAQVSSFVFHGVPMNFRTLLTHREMLTNGPQISAIALIVSAIPAVMILRGLFDYGNAYYMQWVSNRVVTDVRNDLFSKMVRHSIDFFNRMRTGFLMSRIANDTRNMQQALTTVSSDIFKQPVQIIGAVTALLILDWRFTAVILVLFPICLVPIQIYGKRARTAVKQEQKAMGGMSVTMQETFSGIRVIKSFGREEYQENLFRRASQRQFWNAMRMVKSTEATGPLVEIIASFGVALAMAYVYFAGLSAAKFLGLILGFFLLYEPVKKLSKLHLMMQRFVAATAEIFSILDSVPTVRDSLGSSELVSSEGRIGFENVTFRYATGTEDAVRDLNLRIEPGKTYALVGVSGAGKSTLLSLILRLYDPTAGVIKIDNYDLRSVTQESLRKQIGLVTQETFLFHDTIFRNIQFGRLDATPDEVHAAARAAYAHEFITAQPNGYETVIGDKGCLLSGGQQQRLAIARALLKNAPILLLDEATSSLDSESEKQIQLALEKLSAGRTVIAIAHRLSTILSADQIVVLDQGRIKEIGTHAELLEKSVHYRRLYDLQFNQPALESRSEQTHLVEELV